MREVTSIAEHGSAEGGVWGGAGLLESSICLATQTFNEQLWVSGWDR